MSWPIREVSGNCLQVIIGEQPIAINNHAHAHLVAAAPELLEACKAGLQSLVSLWRSEFETRNESHPEDRDPAVAQMKAAIVKAEVGSEG